MKDYAMTLEEAGQLARTIQGVMELANANLPLMFPGDEYEETKLHITFPEGDMVLEEDRCPHGRYERWVKVEYQKSHPVIRKVFVEKAEAALRSFPGIRVISHHSSAFPYTLVGRRAAS